MYPQHHMPVPVYQSEQSSQLQHHHPEPPPPPTHMDTHHHNTHLHGHPHSSHHHNHTHAIPHSHIVDAHQHQAHGVDLIGHPIHFVTGQFAGQTMRAELHEVQKADLGRKYARVDRRPLDPPPVVLLRLFHVLNPGTDRETEKEVASYEEVQILGLVCTVDLFPVPSQQSTRIERPESTQSNRSQFDSHSHPTTAAHNTPQSPHLPLPSSSEPASTSAPASHPQGHHHHHHQQHYAPEPKPYQNYTFISSSHSYAHADASSSNLSNTAPSSPSGYPSPVNTPQDIVHRVGGHVITESSKLTQALVGATFVQPATVEYQGKMSLVFVFADLAVKTEGTFILRYRVFDIFSRPNNHQEDLAIQAECYGGSFRVYSTKEFPGLQASTDLTKHLARWGVRLNIRETERRRRKKGEARSLSPPYKKSTEKRKFSSPGSGDTPSDED